MKHQTDKRKTSLAVKIFIFAVFIIVAILLNAPAFKGKASIPKDNHTRDTIHA